MDAVDTISRLISGEPAREIARRIGEERGFSNALIDNDIDCGAAVLDALDALGRQLRDDIHQLAQELGEILN